jgi:hypothetical protein
MSTLLGRKAVKPIFTVLILDALVYSQGFVYDSVVISFLLPFFPNSLEDSYDDNMNSRSDQSPWHKSMAIKAVLNTPKTERVSIGFVLHLREFHPNATID